MFYCDTIIVGRGLYPKKIKEARLRKLIMRYPLTYKADPEDKRDYNFSSNFESVEEMLFELPVVVDHTSDMTPIKDQGQLGSCVGFAVTALKEWQEAKEHEAEILEGKRDHRKGKQYDLSESWLYWNCKEIDEWRGEEGTSIRYAMQVLRKVGVPTEKAWPYDDIVIGKPKSWAPLVSKWSLIDSYWRLNNLSELKAALKNGPVPIGMACFREIFYVRTNGVIEYPANPNEIYGGHAVCAVGYNDETKRIKFKNSWGSSWGDRGYGYIGYNYINDFMWDAWTCKDLAVTKEMLKGTRKLI